MADYKGITSAKKQLTNKTESSAKSNTIQKLNSGITLKLLLKTRKNLMRAETKY
jgi:hypothetical protein